MVDGGGVREKATMIIKVKRIVLKVEFLRVTWGCSSK